MSDSAVLEAKPRTEAGKQSSKHYRIEGAVPAVVYGSEIDSIKCAVDLKAFQAMIHEFGRNAIVSLKIAGSSETDYSTIVKEIQHHPVTGNILHIDFHRISMTKRLIVEVAVHSEGVPTGVRNDGGILEQMLHEVEVECLPTNIPEVIVFEVSELEIGDTIHVSDLVTLEGTVIVTDNERTVFTVAPPTVPKDGTEDEEGEEPTEDQEPEVIERGKKDGEEDEEGGE